LAIDQTDIAWFLFSFTSFNLIYEL